MRIILSSLASAGLFALGGNVLAAETPKTISDCVEIADNDDRLACFDELAREPEIVVAPAAPEVKETPVQKERRLFGFNRSQRAETEEEFGAVANPKEPKLVEEISSRITNIDFLENSRMRVRLASRIYLDNGQIWRQLDADTTRLRKVNSEIVYTANIKQSMFGNYRMTIEPMGQTIRVRRIK